MKTAVRLLRLHNYPILQQLWLEEALFRAHSDNWFVINDGAETPAIVLGISGKPLELVHIDQAHSADIPLIKRFTGGGTVIVDHDTIFTSLIMNESAVPNLPCFPRPIMEWTEQLYATALSRHGPFALRQHDYVYGERKFGGNAQAITKNRWLHHTSMLWDYQPERMNLLKEPVKRPEYRRDRSHLEFVVGLKDIIETGDRQGVIDDLCSSVEQAGFDLIVKETSLEEALDAMDKNTLCGTKLLDYNELLNT